MENEPIRFVTPRMLDAILQKLVNPMDRAMLLLASEGLRTEEIVRLTIDDIDVENNSIRIQGEEGVYCIPVCKKTIDECLAAHKQRTYKSLATVVNRGAQRIVDSEYIIRPINLEQSLSHMTRSGIEYRAKNIFSPDNIGIVIFGGLEAIRVGRVMYELYNNKNNKVRFDSAVIFVLKKFYQRTERSSESLSRQKKYMATICRNFSAEFGNILNNEDAIVDKILSTITHKTRETVSSITEHLTTKTDLRQLPTDKAIEYYLLSIKQKMLHHSAQSIEKMVFQLTKWSNKNGIAFSDFTKNDAINFIISLEPKGKAEAERRIATASNFFKYLCAIGNTTQNPFEDLSVEEVWKVKTNSAAKQLTMVSDPQKLSMDEAIEYYLLSIQQKAPRSLQSIKKMVDKLTKWSEKNGVTLGEFNQENAIDFIVSLDPPHRAEAKRYAGIASNFFKYLCSTGHAAQNPFENLDVEEVWEAKNRLKKK